MHAVSHGDFVRVVGTRVSPVRKVYHMLLTTVFIYSEITIAICDTARYNKSTLTEDNFVLTMARILTNPMARILTNQLNPTCINY